MNQTSKQSNRKADDVSSSEALNKISELNQKIDDVTLDVKKTNEELEAKYAKYLDPNYTPEGYVVKGLKDKINEATDQKEIDDLTQEVDDKLAEIMSDVIDEAEKE